MDSCLFGDGRGAEAWGCAEHCLGAHLLPLCGTWVFSMEVGSCWGGKRASDRAALPYGAALDLQLSLLLPRSAGRDALPKTHG